MTDYVYASTDGVNGHVLYVRGIETAIRTCLSTNTNKRRPIFCVRANQPGLNYAMPRLHATQCANQIVARKRLRS